MLCAICVELRILDQLDGSMQDAITQVNGTALCLGHAEPFFEKMRKELEQSERLIASLNVPD